MTTTATFDVEATLAKLSLSDKIKLLTGQGWWHTEAIPEHNVPALRLSDGGLTSSALYAILIDAGPNGVRGTRFFNGVPSSCFPAATGLGSTFDVDLVYKIGEALGEEARAKSCHVLLAPTVNTQRSPLGGRSFESFSEDPHLNGTIAAAYINGVQSKGVAAAIKHFVANDQEYQRKTINSIVSERALREIYLKPFQIAIKKANPWALMTAYNRVNGTHASENKRLLQDVLRDEWQYEGMIMSDWFGVYSTTESMQAGLDLEMPGPAVVWGKALERALSGGKLSPSDVDTRVRKVLQLVKKGHESEIPSHGPEGSVDTPELRQLLRAAAADSIVLLKNDKNILPLSSDVKNIAVIGPNAKHAITSGGGSAKVLSTYTVSPLDGIRTAAKEIGAEVRYSVGTNTTKHLPLADPYVRQKNGEPGALLEFWNEAPSEDFTSNSSNLTADLKPPVWSTTTRSTNAMLTDGVSDTVNLICWIRLSAIFVPDEDGDWEFGLKITGSGNLSVDGNLVIDLSAHTDTNDGLMGLGDPDVCHIVRDMKAGQEYNVEIRLSNVEFAPRLIPYGCWGVVKLGANRVAEQGQAVKDAVQLAQNSSVVVLVVGLNHDFEGEGFDREDLELPGLTNQLVYEVLKANPKTIVVNQSGAPVSMPWIDEASTILQAFYGGNEVGNGLADVLFGKVNPSAKLSLTFPKRVEDTPPYPSFGAKTQEYGKAHYNEGIFVGYRSYDVNKLKPLFPFGHGLSYTRFEYSSLDISPISSDGTFTVSFDVTNTGSLFGREASQIYICDEESSLTRPIKELKGFIKLALEPGETKTATVTLGREALSFFDDHAGHWLLEKGLFVVKIASSSADIRLPGELFAPETIAWNGL